MFEIRRQWRCDGEPLLVEQTGGCDAFKRQLALVSEKGLLRISTGQPPLRGAGTAAVVDLEVERVAAGLDGSFYRGSFRIVDQGHQGLAQLAAECVSEQFLDDAENVRRH